MQDLPNSGLNAAWLGAFHAVVGLLALIAGGRVVKTIEIRDKRHHMSGGVYVGCMLCTCGSALATSIYTGRFSVFHALAILVLVALFLGILPLVGGKLTPFRLHLHGVAMSWSYVALWAAFIAELLVRGLIYVPGINPVALWTQVIFAILATCLIGVLRIHIAPARRMLSVQAAILQ